MNFVFVIFLKQFFWAQRNLGSIKKLLPQGPRGYGRAQTSAVYFIKWYIKNHTMLITILQHVTQTHRDVSIVHCVRTHIIVYSTPHRLFLFVAENRSTYSSRTWNDLQLQKQKTHRKSLVVERFLVNARSYSEPQRISKLLYRFKTVDIYLQTVLHQCFHR